MTRYITAWGDEFNNKYDALDAILQNMEWNDYAHYMQYSISWDRLFEWAHNQPGFFEEFENDFSTAEEEFFNDNCEEVEEG